MLEYLENAAEMIVGCFIALLALALAILLSPVFWLAVIAVLMINQ